MDPTIKRGQHSESTVVLPELVQAVCHASKVSNDSEHASVLNVPSTNADDIVMVVRVVDVPAPQDMFQALADCRTQHSPHVLPFTRSCRNTAASTTPCLWRTCFNPRWRAPSTRSASWGTLSRSRPAAKPSAPTASRAASFEATHPPPGSTKASRVKMVRLFCSLYRP
jgi:hypothetical protein